MKVALVHHHLRPGGVTRVLTNQAAALRERAQVVILSGEAPDRPPPAPWALVPALAYVQDLRERTPPEEVARQLRQAAHADLYHFHNPTLGKNPDLPAVIERLRSAGEQVLLQVHDFAEDGRPGLYPGAGYPADCHYAVINRRDYGLLQRAGLLPAGLHYLPNPVQPLAVARGARGEQRLILYPVRAIRRKNLGEALLLTLFFPAGCSLGITRDPTDPLDILPFRTWQGIALAERLPVRFGLGEARSLEQLFAETRAVLTTSVQESFGMTFLEPWTAGIEVQGRLLPDICADFTAEGIRLDHLYRSLQVPVALLAANAFRSRWLACYRARRTRFGLEPDAGEGEAFLEALLAPGSLDFGLLSEDLQWSVVRQAIAGGRVRRRLVELNPFLESLFRVPVPEESRQSNREAVGSRYSLQLAGARLWETYLAVLGTPVRHAVDRTALARAFNSPDKILLSNAHRIRAGLEPRACSADPRTGTPPDSSADRTPAVRIATAAGAGGPVRRVRHTVRQPGRRRPGAAGAFRPACPAPPVGQRGAVRKIPGADR